MINVIVVCARDGIGLHSGVFWHLKVVHQLAKGLSDQVITARSLGLLQGQPCPPTPFGLYEEVHGANRAINICLIIIVSNFL